MSEHDARSIPYFLWKGRFVKESGKFLEDRRKSRKFSITAGFQRGVHRIFSEQTGCRTAAHHRLRLWCGNALRPVIRRS